MARADKARWLCALNENWWKITKERERVESREEGVQEQKGGALSVERDPPGQLLSCALIAFFSFAFSFSLSVFFCYYKDIGDSFLFNCLTQKLT